MGKKTTLTTAVLFAMGSMGTCMASQLPSDSNILNLPLPDTPEYVAASNSQNDEIVIVAKKVAKKKAVKKRPAKKKVAKKKVTK